ncbi:hypothetical protein I549_1794 [Mycobacterium avium subsp. avium 2285 (R)]|nr:hypothetical protein I549_1794 [Mycobacterium avium subsp. avium 2285 (R)]
MANGRAEGDSSMARTDDDTWDLATSVGATATMVAAGRAGPPGTA